MKGGDKILQGIAAQPDDEFFKARMAEAPKQEHVFYYDEFLRLSTLRNYELGAIPIDKIEASARTLPLSTSEQRAYTYIIHCLDRAYLSTVAEKNKAGSK